MNYNFVNYDTQREIYEAAQKLTAEICEELYKRVSDSRIKKTVLDKEVLIVCH